MLCSEAYNEKNEVNGKDFFRIKELDFSSQIVWIEKPIILYIFLYHEFIIYRLTDEVIVGNDSDKIQMEMRMDDFFKKYTKVFF